MPCGCQPRKQGVLLGNAFLVVEPVGEAGQTPLVLQRQPAHGIVPLAGRRPDRETRRRSPAPRAAAVSARWAGVTLARSQSPTRMTWQASCGRLLQRHRSDQAPGLQPLLHPGSTCDDRHRNCGFRLGRFADLEGQPPASRRAAAFQRGGKLILARRAGKRHLLREDRNGQRPVLAGRRLRNDHLALLSPRRRPFGPSTRSRAG